MPAASEAATATTPGRAAGKLRADAAAAATAGARWYARAKAAAGRQREELTEKARRLQRTQNPGRGGGNGGGSGGGSGSGAGSGSGGYYGSSPYSNGNKVVRDNAYDNQRDRALSSTAPGGGGSKGSGGGGSWLTSSKWGYAAGGVLLVGAVVTAPVWGTGAAVTAGIITVIGASWYALAASDSLSCTPANAPKKPSEQAPARSKGPAQATGPAGQAAQAAPDVPEGARAPQENPEADTVPNPPHVYWEEDGCTVVGLKREGQGPRATVWDCAGYTGPPGTSAPREGSSSDSTDPSGSATIYLDQKMKHATIAVTWNGETIHSHQGGYDRREGCRCVLG